MLYKHSLYTFAFFLIMFTVISAGNAADNNKVTVKSTATLPATSVVTLTIHDALGHTKTTTATFNSLTYGYSTSNVLTVTMDVSTSKIYCGDFE